MNRIPKGANFGGSSVLFNSTNHFNMNSNFPPLATVSSPREPIPYICGLGARFGCERVERVFKPLRLKSPILGIGSLGERHFAVNQNSYSFGLE